MQPTPDAPDYGPLRHRAERYLLALGIVAAATVLRSIVDPLFHNQLPYMFYVAAVVAATWLCGTDAGIMSMIVAAFVANYFFVPQRYQIIPHDEDWRAMGTFWGVSLSVVWFVARSRRAEREVRVLHAKTATALDQLSAATLAAEVGVWSWQPGTSDVSVGANWRGLFGIAADTDVTFETWAGALHPDDRERAVETLNTAWRDHREFICEYRIVWPDGSLRWVIDRGRAIRDAHGKAVRMAGVNVDITTRKTAEEAQRDANRLKDEFLATLSHELRTPLNAIVGWSDMLRRRALQAEQADRAMQAVYRNAKTLSEMIDDVLDVSRIMSGKVRIEIRPMDPVAVLRNAVEAVRSAADAKDVAIVTEFGAVPYPVTGDPTRLQQVFWNLLSNAVKFTAPGGRVRLTSEVSHEHLVVQVSDTGIGIRPDFLPHVFERFRQSDSSTTRLHTGLGLGLAIVKHLVELHGGTVEAESPGEGEGATFTVRLPAQRVEDRRHVQQAPARTTRPVERVGDDVPALCGARVLVVDDQSEAREVAASVLQHYGASVEVAANAQQALDHFARFEPTVLLIDVAMPDIDGYGLIERIRTSTGERGRQVPAIAFTAYAREEDQRRVLASGFQLHLAKPVDSHTLVRAVASVSPGHPPIS